MRALRVYACAILLSAALLFSVQPMFAKMALPLLGGTPAVWNTCMVFFQAMLLAGYAYAHLTTRWLGDRAQSLVHLAVCLLPLAVLPIALPAGWTPPTESTPVFWLLGMLAVAVGAPFFVVSTTAPLLQHWFSRTDHPAAADPYFLYAASNIGSMAALLGYPTVIEPVLRLQEQSRVWTGGYAVLCVLMAVCAAFLWFAKRNESTVAEPLNHTKAARKSSRRSNAFATVQTTVTTGRRLRWVVLSFVPSSWLLGVTTHITTDIAPVPMLWVIPLALYLLSFILVFAERTRFLHAWMVRLFPLGLMLLVLSVIFKASWIVLVIHLVVFFVGCMVCHGDLARLRPPVSHLTEFYFWMSVGGVLGGVFNAIIAPLAFRWLLEYPIALFLAAWLRPSLYPEPRTNQRRLGDLANLLVFVLVFAALYGKLKVEGNEFVIGRTIYASAALVLFYFLDWPQPFAIGVGALLLLAKLSPPVVGTLQFTGRSFFGVHWVVDDPTLGRQLLNGTTKHGLQSLDPARRCEPLYYYSRGGPLGQVFASFRPLKSTNKVAVIGLGAGAMACYRDTGVQFTFYEIDPLVKQIAESPALFTHLSDCARGSYQIVLGDGRLKLAEAPRREYAMIVFDAFSSDSIPMHLLTREALAMYLDKLADGGILVFHVSNRHLDLSPVLAGLAADAGLVAMLGEDSSRFASEQQFQAGYMPSDYIVLARDRSALADLPSRGNWSELPRPTHLRPWTDDYSSLVSILRWE